MVSHRRPTVACLLFTYYKPFMWCRIDARLWHVCYFFTIYALYVASHRCPTTACLLFISLMSPFCGVAQTPDWGILFYSLIALVLCCVNNLSACIMDYIFGTDVVIIEYFRAWLLFVILYPCSKCLRVHSKYSLACPWLLSWPDFLRGEEQRDDSPET